MLVNSWVLQDFVLVDNATGPVFLRGWTILGELASASGVLAAAVVLLAVAVGIGASHLHVHLVLRRQQERFDPTYRDIELEHIRGARDHLEKQLAATEQRLKAVQSQRAEYRRSLRIAERERDRALRAAAAERTRADSASLAIRDLLRKLNAHNARSDDPRHPARRPTSPSRAAPRRSTVAEAPHPALKHWAGQSPRKGAARFPC